jgi:hypothetical protein
MWECCVDSACSDLETDSYEHRNQFLGFMKGGTTTT